MLSLLVASTFLTWPQFHAEPQHGGIQAMKGALTSATVFTKWQTVVGGQTSRNSALIADVDGDGAVEVVAPVSGNNTVYCLNGLTGAVEWTSAVAAGGFNNSHPASGDLVLGNGALEIVVRGNNSTLFCLRGTDGAVLWQYAGGGSSSYIAPPTVAEVVPGNGTTEVLFGSASGTLYCLRGDNGTLIWSYAGGVKIEGGPTVEDLVPGNGTLEVVFGQGGSSPALVICLRGDDGSFIWQYNTANGVRSTPAVGDLVPGNGTLEVVISGETGLGARCLRGDDGSELWYHPMGRTYNASPAIADLDGDGDMDVTVSTCGGADLRAIDSATGALLWASSLGSCTGGASPVVCDIDGDGALEVISTSDDGNIRSFTAASGVQEWILPYQSGGGLDGTPVAGDIDGDSCSEVVVAGGSNSWVTAFDGNGSGCSPVAIGVGERGFRGSLLVTALPGAIRVTLSDNARVEVIDAAGRLAVSRDVAAGSYTFGAFGPRGVYVVRVVRPSGVAVRKVLLVK